jgi:hypothetical protein
MAAVENGYRIVAVVQMSEEDIEGGRLYEDVVLDLLPSQGGRVERRLRTPDARTEVQVLWFPSREAMEAVVAHPDRLAARDRLGSAVPVTVVHEVHDVPVPPA